jgi:protein-L-isoaspartate(D-aspartate) O-methyltransferase
MVSFNEKNIYEMARQAMLNADLRGRDIRDIGVLEVMAAIPREAFVPAKYAAQSYSDYPLPIGMGQTISQPYIVALMTQCLNLTGSQEVLEIGTGSGYQTAILAKLAAKVYTIERFNELAQSAQTVLAGLGLSNIEFYIGDGSAGWPQNRQFDRIVITAGVPEVPPPLIGQLADGGILVAPIGGQWTQELVVAKKHQGHLSMRNVCGCRFVPLIGKYGYSE